MILSASTTLHAQQSIPDWRLLGGTSDATTAFAFYDANSVRKLGTALLEVWLHVLPQGGH